MRFRLRRDVGPFYSTKDWGNKCLRDVLYVRRGSVNECANREEQRATYEWFGRVTSVAGDTSGEQWRRFVDATDNIDVSRQYILISDAIGAAGGAAIGGLGQLPWFAVIDFDPNSENGGLLQAIGGTLKRTRTLQLAVKGDRSPVHSRNQAIWFFARGLAGRIGTEVEPDPRVWIRSYGKEIDQLTEHLAKAAAPAPITVVVLWQEPSTLKLMTSVLDSIMKAFGEAARIVAVTGNPKVEGAVTPDYGLTVALDVMTLAEGVSHIMLRQRDAVGSPAFPSPSGTPCSLKDEDRLWLEEELSPAHLDAWREGPDHPEPFRRGEMITWADLNLHHDCDRSVTSALRDRVRADLRECAVTRINLYHPPGAGGSTVARRVLWDLHEQFPAVVLRHLVPEQTACAWRGLQR